MIEFTAFKHPVLAVPCPDCRRPPGAMCSRPSGHRATDFHAARKAAADAAFIAQHGPSATIIPTNAGKWIVDPRGQLRD